MDFNGAFESESLLEKQDFEVFKSISDELVRQENQVELIASENFVSKSVLSAIGSVCTNKYAEGYPGKRYYGGCEFVDRIEQLAIDRICKLFKCSYANVQPHSGAQANFSVFYALMNPGDVFLGMELAMGGHLTHGAKVSVSGKWFNCIPYGLNADGIIDYDNMQKLAVEFKPKVIVCGASAYSQKIDFKKVREIADKVGSIVVADVAHYAGLIVADCYPSPFPYAHIVTSTTHKTLRGPRGGIILTNDESLAKKINSAVFPGVQGGPHMHTIAGKAVAFGEALKPEFKMYAKQVIKNAKVLAETLKKNGIDLVSNGTECHMVLANLISLGVTGKDAEIWLDRAGITCNKNAIPFDPLPPSKASGIRLGTPAMTTRGLKELEFEMIGNLIAKVLKAGNQIDSVINSVRSETLAICNKFPIYRD